MIKEEEKLDFKQYIKKYFLDVHSLKVSISEGVLVKSKEEIPLSIRKLIASYLFKGHSNKYDEDHVQWKSHFYGNGKGILMSRKKWYEFLQTQSWKYKGDWEGLSDSLSDTFYEPIPFNFALKLAPVIDRAPQMEFNRLAKNPAVAYMAILLMKEFNVNIDGLVKDSTTLTDEGVIRLKEGLWQTLFPNTKTTDFPDHVTDKFLKNLSAMLIIKNNPKVFTQFQTALVLGQDWKLDGRAFEEYVQVVQFDDPIDAEEFLFLCPYLYDVKNDKFAWLLKRYIQNGGADKEMFVRSLSTDSGQRIAKQESTGLSDSYIWGQ